MFCVTSRFVTAVTNDSSSINLPDKFPFSQRVQYCLSKGERKIMYQKDRLTDLSSLPLKWRGHREHQSSTLRASLSCCCEWYPGIDVEEREEVSEPSKISTRTSYIARGNIFIQMTGWTLQGRVVKGIHLEKDVNSTEDRPCKRKCGIEDSVVWGRAT